MNETELRQFIRDEVEREKGVCHPIKASLLERLFVRRMSCKKLHPNPDDEFCFPEIGPHMGIITKYEKQFLLNRGNGDPIMEEPLFIQKVIPDGYIVLNGHHRWSAAMRLGIKRIPVRVVNMANEADIKRMLESSDNDRRAAFDLDEVIFRPAHDPFVERSFSLFRAGIQKSRLRRGIPALFSFLSSKGYDVWVYSSRYYSIDDVQKFLKHYSIAVNGIITGKRGKTDLEKLAGGKYKETIHIDNDLILVTSSVSKDFREIDIDSDPENWSKNVLKALEGFMTEKG